MRWNVCQEGTSDITWAGSVEGVRGASVSVVSGGLMVSYSMTSLVQVTFMRPFKGGDIAVI